MNRERLLFIIDTTNLGDSHDYWTERKYNEKDIY